MTWVKRTVAGALAAALGGSLQSRAHATDVATALYVESFESASCVTEARFRARVREILGRRPSGGVREGVVISRVTIERSPELEGEPPRVHGTLDARDARGVASTRTITGADCDVVVDALAVLVALALDAQAPPAQSASSPTSVEAPEQAAKDGDFIEPKVAVWPAERPPTPPRTKRPRRRGSGGVALSALYGSGPVEGLHAYGAVRVDKTRVGAAGTLVRGEHRAWTDTTSVFATTVSARVGAIIGWGAPWNDVVAGFVGEAGLTVGHDRGRMGGALASGASENGGYCEAIGRCYAPLAAPLDRTWASPYLANTLVLQVPWKLPVRPIAGLTALVMPTRPEIWVALQGEAGLVWQAW